jgi:hypothetical protein
MSDDLYDELITLGYLPELKFQPDSHTKLLYIKNIGDLDVRLSQMGQFNLPTFPLYEQNETTKAVVGGTRVHLGTDHVPDLDQPWSCIGNVTNTAALLYTDDGISRTFKTTITDDESIYFYVSTGSGFLGSILLSNANLANFLTQQNISLSFDSGAGAYFVNNNQEKAYQFQLEEINGSAAIELISWDEQINTSIHYVADTTKLRFCLSPHGGVTIPISCDGATDTIGYQMNHGNLLDIRVDDVSYGSDISAFWTNETLSQMFNADYDSSGYITNRSDTPHRIIFVGDNLNFIDLSDPVNPTVIINDTNVGVCLAAQPIIIP